MTILVILGIVIGAALVVAAVAYTRRSRESKEPIQLDVGRKRRV
jgi:ABC-type antimicrobial peptide transport system permease subunit